MYRLFVGIGSKTACVAQICKPTIRYPNQHGLHPHLSTFSTPQNVRNTIGKLQFVKTQDHEVLVGAHYLCP